MKHIRTIALLLCALALSFVALVLWAMYTPQDSGTPTSADLCAQVVTDARNPTTGEVQEFQTPCDVPLGWDTLETDREVFVRNDEEWKRYRNDDLGVRFEYRTSPHGYLLIEHEDAASDVSLSLFNKEEYAEMLGSGIAREAPPSIAIRIFENAANVLPREWAYEHTGDSNIALASNIRDVTFAGVAGIRYTVDGLYTSDVLLLLNNGRVYLLSGEYHDNSSSVRNDFLEILTHVSLY